MRRGSTFGGIRIDRRAVAVMAAAVCCAAAAAEPEGVLVPVRLPITGTRDTQVEGAILRHVPRLRGRPGERGVLVLRFDVGDEADGASDFGRALELARFLVSDQLAGVKTVAWLPEGAMGHAVLAALACEEIVMPAAAVLGPASAADADVDDAMRAAYRQIASSRRTVPAAVALALLDPAARVVRVSTDAGEEFVEERDLPDLRRRAAVLGVEPLRPAPIALDGRRCRELGFVRQLTTSPADVAAAVGVEERALAGDPSRDGGWKAVEVPFAGPVGAELVARVRGRIDRAITEGANFICLRIESPGGDPRQALVLANWLAGIDPAAVRTVAWVPREARGDAALIALACDEIVMRPDAVLGGEGAAAIDGRVAEAISASWRGGVARVRDRSWSLPLAVVVPGLEVRRAVQQGTGRVAHFAPQELATRKDRDSWQLGAAVGGSPLQLDGPRAETLGIAAHVVEGFDGLRQAYGLGDRVSVSEPGWADRLLTALASPELAWLLLLIGGAGLYIELKTPGVGFGGFVSMVAFIIYFWSQHLHGTSGWLEVMLFLAGLVCVAAEIFVLPGFGVLGLGGGLLVVASIVLASQSFVLPINDYQMRSMQWSLFGILSAVAGVAVAALILGRLLPATPVLRDVLLAPPAPDDDVAGEESLLGAVGTTTSRLAPAGMARIGDAVRDVTSDGELIEPGTPVRVVAVRGGRIVVRQA